ncbi:unnamed protein product [Schistosoma rodhaini]|uniref:Centrosomal protein of 97 kDa n=1 Tax=Schistosoma rodhaini TaxID=6188 RepID=A0AA85GES7_9TREM|nr:unnamed protein product [Schistosoma rodhaini]
MRKLIGQGFQDLPTFIGPNGEITLNIARSGIESIETLPVNINVLILDHNYIRRLENLSTLCNLQQLSVADNKLLQMHGVAGLINLTILNLPNNGIVTMDGLAKLTNLRWLNLSGNKLKVIEQLDTNLNLKHLDLSDNYIYELQDLSHLTKLKTLLLHCNHISTLHDGSRNLPKSLEILSLASNMVSNILEVQELSCLPMLTQFSLGNNPCIESFANDYKLFVLGWLPNLRILDGTRITKEDIEKANTFISGIKSSMFIQSWSHNEPCKSNQDIDNGIVTRNYVHPIRTELITHEAVNHNVSRNHHSRSTSSCTRFSAELNQNLSCEDVSSNSVSGISNKSCTGEPTSTVNNSCSNGDRNHMSQSISPSVITTINPTANNYLLNNNSMASSILNNGNIPLNQNKCNNKTKSTESVDMSSLSYSSCPANPKLNINNINDNKSLFITHETSSSSSTSYPMANPQPLLKMSTNSPRQVLPEIKEGKFKIKLTDELPRMNSYCNDQLVTSSSNLLSSDSVYLPLNVSNTTNNIEETFETGYKAKTHSNAVHHMLSNAKDWQSIDKKLSLKLSPSDSLLSSGNFIPLHQSMYSKSPTPSNSLTNSIHSIKSKEDIKFETLGFINGVHLIHDGEENEEDDDNIDDDDEDVITTETTVQSSRFIELIDKPNGVEQSKEGNITTLDNNNNNIDEKDILLKEVSDDMDLNCLINLKHKINTQSMKVHKSITKDQQKEIFDTNIKQQSGESVEVNEDSKLVVNNDVNDNNLVESNSVATDRYNVVTTTLDNPLINKCSHNSNPITLLSSTSSVTTTSLSNYCPTCGNQTKLLQDHVIFLQKQLQTQYKSNEAESKLNQLHSNSIQFLLKEVQELKAWKESISLKLTNSTYKSIEFSSNYTQTDIQDIYHDQRQELTENTVNLLDPKESDDNNDSSCIQLPNNMIEQNHMEDNTCKINSNNHLLTNTVQLNSINEEQNKKSSYELSRFNEYEEDKTLSSFAKMSTTELSKLSELHHTLHCDNKHFDKNENNNQIILMNNILQRSSYGNTSNILGTHQDIESNTTVTDSYDLEDFSDLELVRQAAIQAMNLNSTSIDASIHSNSSLSIGTSSIS